MFSWPKWECRFLFIFYLWFIMIHCAITQCSWFTIFRLMDHDAFLHHYCPAPLPLCLYPAAGEYASRPRLCRSHTYGDKCPAAFRLASIYDMHFPPRKQQEIFLSRATLKFWRGSPPKRLRKPSAFSYSALHEVALPTLKTSRCCECNSFKL